MTGAYTTSTFIPCSASIRAKQFLLRGGDVSTVTIDNCLKAMRQQRKPQLALIQSGNSNSVMMSQAKWQAKVVGCLHSRATLVVMHCTNLPKAHGRWGVSMKVVSGSSTL